MLTTASKINDFGVIKYQNTNRDAVVLNERKIHPETSGRKKKKKEKKKLALVHTGAIIFSQ